MRCAEQWQGQVVRLQPSVRCCFGVVVVHCMACRRADAWFLSRADAGLGASVGARTTNTSLESATRGTKATTTARWVMPWSM
eukprot:1703276-Rhodomonas_salina.1